MPIIELDNNDIIKALNYLTNNRYNINSIVSKKFNKKGEVVIFWSHKNLSGVN